jgi:hypothetical protein
VAELAPADEEVASLRIREAGARWHANEAKEKLTALAERTLLDVVEFEWLRKERDELLLAVEGLRREREKCIRSALPSYCRSASSRASLRRRKA